MKYHKIPPAGTIMELQKQDLACMQDGLAEGINGLLSLLGNGNYIISGVEENGTNLTDGWIYYNNELLRFKGGAINAKFVILDEEQIIGTGDYERYATPGSSIGAITLSSLQRVSQLYNLLSVQNDLEDLSTLVNGLFKTGMIMPFMGSIAPSGWLLCNGNVIPDDVDHAALRALVGSSTPNLDGQGIVGAGARSVGSVLGNDDINLIEGQLPSHTHDKGTLSASGGSHQHRIVGEIMQKDGSSTKTVSVLDTGLDPNHGTRYKYTDVDGSHNHTISGSTAAKGNGDGIDIRNRSIAANFIIKI
jgi:hypothetical protein